MNREKKDQIIENNHSRVDPFIYHIFIIPIIMGGSQFIKIDAGNLLRLSHDITPEYFL